MRQGCILLPILFSLVLMEKVAEERQNFLGATLHTNNVGLLAYADSVVMIAINMDEVNQMFTLFQEMTQQIGRVYSHEKGENRWQ